MDQYRFPVAGLRQHGNRVAPDPRNEHNVRVTQWRAQLAQQDINPDFGIAPSVVAGPQTRGRRERILAPSLDAAEMYTSFHVPSLMRGRNIQSAFSCYDTAMSLAMPNCSIPPYDTANVQHIETLFVCASIATLGAFAGQPEPVEHERMAYIIGNGFAIDLPDSMMLGVEESNAVILDGARLAAAVLTQDERAWINANAQNPPWNTPATAQNLNEGDVRIVVECMALHLTAVTRARMMSCYVCIFLAYTQQGSITNNKLNKIVTSLAGQNIQITLTPDLVRIIWDRFGAYFGEEAAAHFFRQYETLFEQFPKLIVLRLIFQQAANAGLTGLTLVREAISKYPQFPWHVLAGHYPDQWNAFVEAHQLVGTNVWFGYRKNLGEVGVRHYSAIVKCAIMIRQEVMGDNNMAALQTVSNLTIADMPFLTRLVNDFGQQIQNRREAGDIDLARRYFDDEDDIPRNFAAMEPVGQAGNQQVLADLIAQIQRAAQQPGNPPAQ